MIKTILNNLKFVIILLSTLVIFAGCENNCCDAKLSDTIIGEKGYKTPVPIISGVPVNATCDTQIIADGSKSYDEDGTIVDYIWTFDGEDLANENNTNITIPCTSTKHKLCLKVFDNQNLSQETCQIIDIRKNTSNIYVDTCNIVPIITYEKADLDQYKFYCKDSYYNNKKIDLNSSICKWSVAKYLVKNNDIIFHSDTTPIKWINVNPDKFSALDVTLTVKNDDCEKAITKHYIIPTDLSLE